MPLIFLKYSKYLPLLEHTSPIVFRNESFTIISFTFKHSLDNDHKQLVLAYYLLHYTFNHSFRVYYFHLGKKFSVYSYCLTPIPIIHISPLPHILTVERGYVKWVIRYRSMSVHFMVSTQWQNQWSVSQNLSQAFSIICMTVILFFMTCLEKHI